MTTPPAPRRRARLGAAAVTVVVALAVAACSSGSGSSSATTGSSTTSTAGSSSTSTSAGAVGPSTTGAPEGPVATTTTAAPGGSTASDVPGLAPIAQPSPAGTWGTEPTVTVPSGPSPTVLQGADLIKGTGPAAADGDNLTVQYVGVSEQTGKTFDASWTDGQPYPFTLGEGQVIAGWDQGIVGMQVGGRRELIIPASLAYGSAGRPPTIGPDATLIFVVDLLKIG